MLEDLGMHDEGDDTVPLPNVDSRPHKQGHSWCTHHKDDPSSEDNKNKEKGTDAFGD